MNTEIIAVVVIVVIVVASIFLRTNKNKNSTRSPRNPPSEDYPNRKEN